MLFYAHDKKKARALAAGKLPVLEFRDGDRKVLLPTGTMINLDKFQGSAPQSGKAARRDRIMARRLARGAIGVPVLI